MGKWLYWLLVVALVGFGSLALFSVGAPFLLLGLTLAVLWPFRRRPQVFWPWLLGVMGFVVGYIVVAPLGCTASAVSMAGMGQPTNVPADGARVVCSSVFGLPYAGMTPYEPPTWPALLAGVSFALALGWTTRLILRRRGREESFPRATR